MALCLGRTAHAEDATGVAVWYRSASGCPDGAAFLHALESRSVHARLAQVGDAIDFVVTLGSDEARGSSGVLERQTDTGTVAIQRVDDPSCEQVAEALSLTLALAIEAGAVDVNSKTETQANTQSRDLAPTTTQVAATPPIGMRAPALIVPSAPRTRASPSVATPEGARASIGVDATVASGIAPGLLPGAGAFVEIEWPRTSIVSPALRVGAFVAYGSGTRSGETITLRILSGRVEACPLELRTGALAWRPCVAFEIGALRSDRDGPTGRPDSGLWAASDASARLTWPAASAFAVEAQLGLGVPWTRYALQSVDDPPSVLHRTSALSLAARIGAVVHFP